MGAVPFAGAGEAVGDEVDAGKVALKIVSDKGLTLMANFDAGVTSGVTATVGPVASFGGVVLAGAKEEDPPTPILTRGRGAAPGVDLDRESGMTLEIPSREGSKMTRLELDASIVGVAGESTGTDERCAGSGLLNLFGSLLVERGSHTLTCGGESVPDDFLF